MKTTCNVIQDLLPLYCDDACSAESRRLVEEHLKECDDCRETYQLMQAALPASAAHTYILIVYYQLVSSILLLT